MAAAAATPPGGGKAVFQKEAKDGGAGWPGQ